jgi:O-antigen/teichoic acid export membrane protein
LLALCQPVLNASVLFLAIIGVYIGMGIYSPALGYLGSFIIFFAVFFLPFIRHSRYFDTTHDSFMISNKRLLLFSLPLVLTGIGATLLNYFDTLMLTYFDDLAVVGVYNIIYPTAFLIVIIGTSLGAILLPVITELWTLKKKKEISYALNLIYKYVFVACLPLILTLIIFSEDLIKVFFGAEYILGVAAFNILLIGAIFKIFIAVNIQVLIAFKKPEKTMNLFLFGAALNVLLNLVFIPLYSITGAAVASSISFFSMAVLSLIQIRKSIRITLPFFRWTLTLMASGIIALLPMILIRLSGLDTFLLASIGLVFGGIFYLIILYMFRIIDIKEIRELFRVNY